MLGNLLLPGAALGGRMSLTRCALFLPLEYVTENYHKYLYLLPALVSPTWKGNEVRKNYSRTAAGAQAEKCF